MVEGSETNRAGARDDTPSAVSDPTVRHPHEAPFGPNLLRLTGGQWIVTAVLTIALLVLIPEFWPRVEPLHPGKDYRVPYRLGYDYWQYERYCRWACDRYETVVLGDSVVWGHYVARDQTLTHHLGEGAGRPRLANLSINGIHPAAMAGLVESYGRSITGRNVIVHCNLLWMSDPRRDLQRDKEFAFNHPRLVPQFYPRIRCYVESLSGRIGVLVERRVPILGWANHLRIAYFDDTDIPMWTMEYPYDNPAGAVTLELPSPDEPPSPEPVALPWTEQGINRIHPPWVELDGSFQWRSFRRVVDLLEDRGNRVFVIVGPFNEHMLEPESLSVYRERVETVRAWLVEREIPHAVPDALPSELFADASHPLAEGYGRLARRLREDESFIAFLRDDRTGGAGAVSPESGPVQ